MIQPVRVVARTIKQSRRVSRSWLSLTVLVGVIVAVGAYPLKVTVDGFTYLSSARSIFTPLAGPNFYWAREPGYPIFLRLTTNLLGTSDIVVASSQALLMAISVAVVGYLYVRGRGSSISILLPVALCVPFFVPQYFGYSSIVLKQPLIGGVLVLGAVVLAASTAVKAPRRVFALLVATLVGAVVAPLVTFNLKYYWIIIAFTVTLVLAIRKYKVARHHRLPRQRMYLVLSLACFVAFISFGSWVASSQGLRAWDDYKEGRTEGTQLSTSFDMAEGSIIKDRLTDPLGILRGLWEETPRLLMISPSDNVGGTKENELYTSFQLDPAWRCGAYDVWTFEPYSSYGRYINGSCRSAGMQSIVRRIHPHSGSFYAFCSWCLIVSPLVILARRNFRLLVISVAPFAFIFTYGFAGGFTIDRYGQPLFPFAFAAFLYVSSSAFAMMLWLVPRFATRIREMTKRTHSKTVSESTALMVN